jgi:hypothetical protein
MNPLRVLLVAVSLAAPIVGANAAVPGALAGKLKSLAGPDSRDCGSVALHDNPDAAIACAKDAASASQAYRLAIEFQGTDSIVWQGAVRDAQGKLWALFYDADRPGGAGAGTTLSVVLCRDIVFASQGDDLIVCRPVIGAH